VPKMIFLNLPVADLAASTRFYAAIGCRKNEAFSDANASSMVWSDEIVFHLLTRDYFSTFTAKPIGDSRKNASMLVALSCEKREDVDTIVNAAAANGGKADPSEPKDHGFMYIRTFEDPDGNIFEPLWLNPQGA
jgi:uncharacterized protein